MRYRPLGSTGMTFSVIGLGTWAIGGSGWSYGWGDQDDEESMATIQRALDLGINWIDTAPVYGLGHAETLVGRAIRGRRDQVWIATKCGLVWDRRGRIRARLTRASVIEECHASLQRLQVDVIDLYQIHWPEPEHQIEEAWETMVQLKEAGKVRHIGVCNFNRTQLERIARIHPVESLQPPYSLLDRRLETDLIPYCRAHRMGVIVYSPLASGLLSGTMTLERAARLPRDDWRRRDPRFRPPLLPKILDFVRDLMHIAQAHGWTVAELAVAWTLRLPEVTAAIVGARRPSQIATSARAAHRTWTDDLERAVQAVLQKHAPTLARVPPL